MLPILYYFFDSTFPFFFSSTTFSLVLPFPFIHSLNQQNFVWLPSFHFHHWLLFLCALPIFTTSLFWHFHFSFHDSIVLILTFVSFSLLFGLNFSFSSSFISFLTSFNFSLYFHRFLAPLILSISLKFLYFLFSTINLSSLLRPLQSYFNYFHYLIIFVYHFYNLVFPFTLPYMLSLFLFPPRHSICLDFCIIFFFLQLFSSFRFFHLCFSSSLLFIYFRFNFFLFLVFVHCLFINVFFPIF